LPYADTDFFIALMRKNDRLNSSARSIYNQYKGDIQTSLAVVAELLLITRRFEISAETTVSYLLSIAEVSDASNLAILVAAHYIDEQKISVFDALNAALCGGKIISSDHIYERLGIERIRL